MAIRVYNRTLHIGIQPYSSYGHTMGIPPYSSYEHTAVLFIPVCMGNALQYFHHVLRTTIWPIKTCISYVSVKTALISVNATSSRTTTRNNRYINNHVNRNDVNSSTVLVFSYRYEHAEDRIPVCRGVCRGVGK